MSLLDDHSWLSPGEEADDVIPDTERSPEPMPEPEQSREPAATAEGS